MKHSSKLSLRRSIYIICLSLIVQSCFFQKDEEPPDDDGDGIENAVDNCPGLPNPDQADANEDGIGDACEGDMDEDGVLDYLDNCPETANEDQADFDGDGIGDLCDETTVTEDQVNIQSALDITFNNIRNLKNGDGLDVVLEDLMGFSNGEMDEELWVDALTAKLGEALGLDEEGEQGIDLNQMGGVYTFKKSDSTWIKNSSSTSVLELKFPTAQNKTTANGQLLLENYKDQTQSQAVGEESYKLPTTLDLSLSVDGEKAVGISLKEIVYGSGSWPIPRKADVELFIAPHSLHLVIDSESDTKYDVDLDISTEDGDSFGVGIEVELAHNDFENIVFEEDIKKLKAEIRLQHLTIVSVSDLAALIALEDPTEAQINELLDLDILINDMKVADVKFSESEEILYLVFKDDSSEDAFNYFEDFFNDVLAMVEDYTGDLFAEEE
ncbi:thrombospondin type 3 repeat-containing protein [Reichenbachiella carrageenanivorans]|uniref:Thrombospondin type 3 repeat-containing protein n=1 Tax=Reichenbachiella carrageenanivorans TaxID=2979869 RepID=A0ABY6CV44_9BACT|nr:thrombospondin type 3 repeat-containing protein [Reichenbachiella carrageenanivorans]UXX77782.1 thrombospondin type 3 repeat-containing protein [Reichenbachiella carrageenanivorans]